MTAALSDSAGLGLIALLFTPIEMVVVYYCTRRAIRSWRRWTR